MGLAIVTAGTSAIGRHLVTALAGAGHDVAFTHLASADLAAQVADQVRALGRRALAIEADAGDEGDAARVHAQAAEWAGDVAEILINNAGVQTWSSLLDLSTADWDRVMHTNLRGTFVNTQAFARMLVAAGKGGSVVNLGSGCNKLAFPKLVDYTASKGGIEQFTKVAAVELGPKGIRVNCVAPGAIATERTASEAGDYAGTWSKVTPLRRVGTPQDIAGPVVFLCSPAADFITGQTIWVDGGVFSQAPWPYET